MQISKVTNDDGMQLAVIITALVKARFDGITGADMDKLQTAKKWLSGLGTQVASELSKLDTPPPAPAGSSPPGFRITKMGSLGTAPKSPKARKK